MGGLYVAAILQALLQVGSEAVFFTAEGRHQEHCSEATDKTAQPTRSDDDVSCSGISVMDSVA